MTVGTGIPAFFPFIFVTIQILAKMDKKVLRKIDHLHLQD